MCISKINKIVYSRTHSYSRTCIHFYYIYYLLFLYTYCKDREDIKIYIFFSFQIFCVSQSFPRLPLQIEDASRPESEEVRHEKLILLQTKYRSLLLRHFG